MLVFNFWEMVFWGCLLSIPHGLGNHRKPNFPWASWLHDASWPGSVYVKPAAGEVLCLLCFITVTLTWRLLSEVVGVAAEFLTWHVAILKKPSKKDRPGKHRKNDGKYHHAIHGNTHYKWGIFPIRKLLNNHQSCHESLKFLVTSWLDRWVFSHGNSHRWPLSVRALPQWLCWVVWQQITMAVRQPSPLQMARRSSVLAAKFFSENQLVELPIRKIWPDGTLW